MLYTTQHTQETLIFPQFIFLVIRNDDWFYKYSIEVMKLYNLLNAFWMLSEFTQSGKEKWKKIFCAGITFGKKI